MTERSSEGVIGTTAGVNERVTVEKRDRVVMFIVIILVLIYDCHNVNGHHVFAIKYAWCPIFTIISRSTFGINSVTYFQWQYIDNKFHIISSSTNTSSFNTRLLIHVYILDASLHRQVYRPLNDEHAAFYCTWISSQQPLLPQSVNATIIYNEQFFCRYSITTVCYNSRKTKILNAQHSSMVYQPYNRRKRWRRSKISLLHTNVYYHTEL